MEASLLVFRHEEVDVESRSLWKRRARRRRRRQQPLRGCDAVNKERRRLSAGSPLRGERGFANGIEREIEELLCIRCINSTAWKRPTFSPRSMKLKLMKGCPPVSLMGLRRRRARSCCTYMYPHRPAGVIFRAQSSSTCFEPSHTSSLCPVLEVLPLHQTQTNSSTSLTSGPTLITLPFSFPLDFTSSNQTHLHHHSARLPRNNPTYQPHTTLNALPRRHQTPQRNIL